MEIWELVAREQIRDTLARYNWSGDAGRVDDLAATFCVDGLLEIRGARSLSGRSEIAGFLRGVTADVATTAGANNRPVVRHILSNVLFVELTAQRAHVWSYFTVVTRVGLDHLGRYRDVLVPAEGTWLIKQRTVSTDWAAPASQMARD
ncbi:nuclear transport factor 2 family protein [Mycobacterium paragordonae]|uniref:nuclear transport factor 2 family protein n=1 Tax=Mycobacterium paragordonae TaxID=1389713 RepID=UPI0012E2DAB8|nr:nuclear transport factor 2 family protein [Mycobacterium paragordonae]